MLEALQFVKGAMSKTTLAPELNHYYIQNGRITGYNGLFMLSAPIDLDLAAAPKAVPFVKAIEACRSEVNLHLTPSNRLAVKSGPFRAYIECEALDKAPIPADFDAIETPVNSSFFDALRTIRPFIAEDASRPWARGVLLKDTHAFATNNIVLIEHTLPAPFPVPINIPEKVIVELLRIAEPLTHLKVSPDAATFHFRGGGWLHTRLLSLEWPDLQRVLNMPAELKPFDSEFKEAIARMLPFIDGTRALRIETDKIRTSEHEMEGAEMDWTRLGLDKTVVFNIDQLLKVTELATHIDMSGYPGPCLFQGENLRGAIVGLRS